MAALAFFHATAGDDLASVCIRLSLNFRGGGAPLPWLLDLPPAALANVYRRFNDVMEELTDDAEG